MKQRWAWGISTDELTIADVLKKAGYRTALFGKWHLGYDFNFHPMNQGFDEFRGYVGGNVDYHTHIAEYGLQELDWWKDKKIKNEEGYTTDLLTNTPMDFIAQAQRQAVLPLSGSRGAPHTLTGTQTPMRRSPRQPPIRK